LPYVCALVLAGVPSVRADAPKSPIEAFAEFATTPRGHRGPTVPFPETPPRPERTGFTLCSEHEPLCVHAPPETSTRRAGRALAAAESAYAWLAQDGWPLPFPDGGRGGGAEFDLYLEHAAERLARAVADAPFDASADGLDAAVTHAFVDVALSDGALEPCATYAIAEAGLLAHDPAEPEDARRALAAFAALRLTGEPGCDAALQDAQAAPESGFGGAGERSVSAAALWLAMLSRRHDSGSGRFVRGAFELARQRSAGPNALRVRPTVWQALSALLEHAGESLDATAEEFALARYFAPYAAGALPRLPRAARITARWAPPLAKLPRHLPVHEPPLSAYGSAYTRIDTSGAAPGQKLEIWLRGERGARWPVSAVRLDGSGRELGRVSAPARNVPESFLPVELTPDTAEVLIAVTKLPLATLAAEDDAHYFKLILNATR
jgi:hypothetical protein